MTKTCLLCGAYPTKGSSITFHCFPTDPQEKNTWLQKLQFVPQVLVVQRYLCSRHFSRQCFSKIHSRTRLKPGSIPTLKLCITNKKAKRWLKKNYKNKTVSTKDLSISLQIEDKIENQRAKSCLEKNNANEDPCILPKIEDETTMLIESDETNGQCNSYCITCATTNGDSYFVVTNKIYLDTTIQEMILLLVPEMVVVLEDHHEICTNCKQTLVDCLKFISQCHSVQSCLLYGKKEYQENVETVETIKIEDDEEYVECEVLYKDGEEHIEEEIEDNNVHDNNDEDNLLTVETVSNNNDRHHGDNDNKELECSDDSSDSNDDSSTVSSLTDNDLDSSDNSVTDTNDHEHCDNADVDNVDVKKEIESVKESESKNTKCEECNVEFENQDEFDEHNKIHVKSGRILCEICGKYYNNFDAYSIHTETHRDYICEICGMHIEGAKNILKHKYSHRERNFKCDKCPKKFRRACLLKEHKNRVHDQKNYVQCTECGKMLKEHSLKVHIETMHYKKGPVQCPECPKTFQTPRYVTVHVKSVHRKIRSTTHTKTGQQERIKLKGYSKTDLLACKICGKSYRGLQYLILHLRGHVEKRYYCRYCGMTIKGVSNGNIKRHEKIHLDNKNANKCNICWRNFSSQEKLEQHLTVHDKLQYKFQCEECGRYFHTKYLLNNHIHLEHSQPEDIELAAQKLINENIKFLNEEREKTLIWEDNLITEIVTEIE